MRWLTNSASRMQRKRSLENGDYRQCHIVSGDCFEILPTLSRLDALVTDPPYGIGFAGQPTKWQRRAGHEAKPWDDSTIDSLDSLIAMADACIIWGGNYYALPPCRGVLSWFKPDAPPSMGHFELAWTTLDRTAHKSRNQSGQPMASGLGIQHKSGFASWNGCCCFYRMRGLC